MYSNEIIEKFKFPDDIRQDQYFEERYYKLKNLKKNKEERNIILDEGGFLKSKICTENDFLLIGGYLNIIHNNNELVKISELKQIVRRLEETIENFDEEKYKNARIENMESRIIEDANNQKEKYYLELNKKPSKDRRKEYVYLILGENGRYKIGCSVDPKNRLASLRLSSCENHELIHTIETKDQYKLESELHEKFKEKRNHSEWFTLSDEDVKYIKTL